MRALIAVIVVAFIAWAGWWVVASRAGVKGAETAFASLSAQGWTARHQGIEVAGFPNRVDLTVTSPEIAPPASAWGWSAPFVQLFALSYKPWHVIAALPERQNLTTPAGPAELTSSSLQASVVVAPSSAVTLERMQVAGSDLVLSGPGTWTAAALSAALRPAVAEINAYDIGFDLTELRPDPQLVSLLPQGLLPETLPLIHIDATTGFTAPLDRHAATTRPQITHVQLREMRAEWGPVRLHLSGRLTPDAAGFAEGKLDLRIEGAATLLELLGASGVIAQKDMRNLTMVLNAMSGGTDSLTVPLNFARGNMTLAVFPLGQAPRLRF